MACGVLVFTSNTASLPEINGDTGLMYAPNDIDDLAQALRAVFDNANLRQTLIERGLAWVKQFAWERSAQQLTSVYERAVWES